jgi:hypothetical protein
MATHAHITTRRAFLTGLAAAPAVALPTSATTIPAGGVKWFADLMASGAIWLVPADRANGELFFERLRELAGYRWAEAEALGAQQ